MLICAITVGQSLQQSLLLADLPELQPDLVLTHGRQNKGVGNERRRFKRWVE